jgi:predicted AAA+ superfamily ATPase
MRWLKRIYEAILEEHLSVNVTRSLLKEPKIYLWDWSYAIDNGACAENFVASHLLKAIDFWTDYGWGQYELNYLRDKEKREVDFLVSKDGEPWFLVEVKNSSNGSPSKSLYYFQKLLKTQHAFQVALDMDYVDIDCFKFEEPIIVPAKTFLSQLV